ncbi:unnamed protein product [Cylicocyclus nassatus]|uniref:Uncharacterized protein n=1 Tax=Cylicocyclus nassatus TaxID=53992 RepID=A0AA36GZE7_CYLNA|nr:unnamed protein product [Cylicocyclus nassatus]
MSSMYKIPPVMPEGFDVKPLDIMYSIPSYHNTSKMESSAECNGVTEDLNDPVKMIEKKQQNLIKSIKDLGSTLEALLQEMGKCGAEPSSSKKSKVEKSASPPETAKPSSKKDKDAKKEARKAAKMEAKSKLASDAPAGKAVDKESAKPWILHEEERATITGQSLTACLPSALTEFPIEKLGEVSITATELDRPWLEVLSHVGERRNVAFKGQISNASSNASTTVNVSLGDKFLLEGGGTTLTCRISAWKLLGSALGLFSFKPEYSLHAIHQHRWLSKVDSILAGKLDKNEAIREASKFLSQFDAFGSHFRFGVADLVAKSVLSGSSPLPNNVELWFKRMETVV